MKVLFAVSNENISESIVKKYQKDYKEIISYKNVYYFNAIIKEIQRDKTYDRIVVSEDLEPFASNDYEAIDRFIFDKLDSISDEATGTEGGDTPIILICSDRRTKSEPLLVKLFSIGVYSALLGQDRSISNVCELIRKPRTKKEAKTYYKIESDDASYQEENEGIVSEAEIQNIRAHYKKLGKNEEAYVDSFNNIASQYNDAQLRLIIRFLPINVKAVLEAKSPKYQSLMSFSGEAAKKSVPKEEKKEEALKIGFIETQNSRPKMTKPVIVPSAVDTKKVTKLYKASNNVNEELTEQVVQNEKTDSQFDDILNEIPLPETERLKEVEVDKTEPIVVQPKKGRGRPKKELTEEEIQAKALAHQRGRGRPKKVLTEEEIHAKALAPKKGRGRPRKDAGQAEEAINDGINLFDLAEEENNKSSVESILPGFNNDQDDNKNVLPGFEEFDEAYDNSSTTTNTNENYSSSKEISNSENVNQSVNIERLLSKDKKIVSFVGTSKNGTSFLVNNLGELFSSMGINTAILDVTKNKNSYFIYTKNEESLRKTAINSMNNLANGMPEGIKVNKDLTIYTSLPSEEESINYKGILETLVKNYSLVLIDCDFDTDIAYFKNSQEIYLVQSMDILTIQSLTAFLRDLKAKGALAPEKIRVVVNKQTRIRGLNPKVIIGGMAYYNDPSMSFMTELFNKDTVRYSVIPLDEQVYLRYLEGLVNCKVSLNGYSKSFMTALKELGNMVYPLLSNKYRPVDSYEKKGRFSSKFDSTLEQMKKNF